VVACARQAAGGSHGDDGPETNSPRRRGEVRSAVGWVGGCRGGVGMVEVKLTRLAFDIPGWNTSAVLWLPRWVYVFRNIDVARGIDVGVGVSFSFHRWL